MLFVIMIKENSGWAYRVVYIVYVLSLFTISLFFMTDKTLGH